ncbi:uncharacterized protein LOC125383463 [Haliotis rufescens]|uniref:uncharacterized protein LOC125383463 n=1 Tax=Haliotis rufescens TaxID=6454 RepID=UPI00201F86C1|nr:uncharacterized protein LOC125383463 [Haliotis rufescens]
MEEFHNQAEFLKVIWKHLYSSSSNKSVGTLHAARSTINAVNVTQDPHDNFYPCSEFMDMVNTAYIVTGGLHHFQMEHLTSVPTPSYKGAVGNPYETIDYFLGHAKQFVDKHV